MLPVLRNTVTGLNGVDPRLSEAARVVGVRRGKLLRDIELPLALPVIMAGIRTSAVWVIGTATLSTPIGQTSLGNYIFTGLQTQNWVFVLFGCIAAAVLALAVDQLLALMQAGVSRRSSRMQIAAGVIGLLLVVLAALLPGLWPRTGRLCDRRQAVHRAIRAGGADQAAAGRDRPYRRSAATASAPTCCSTRSPPARSTASWTIPARSGPTGCTAPTCKPRAEVLAEVGDWLENDPRHPHARPARLRERLCAGDDAQKAPRRSASARSPIWPRMRGELTIAGDYEFFARPEWTAIRKAYGLNFRQQRRCSRSSCTKAAARRGRRHLGLHQRRPDRDNTISSCSTIPSTPSRLTTRSCCCRPSAHTTQTLIAALYPLVGAIPVALMREANVRAATATTPIRRRAWLGGESARRAASRGLPCPDCPVRRRRSSSSARFCVMLRMHAAASMRAIVPSPAA